MNWLKTIVFAANDGFIYLHIIQCFSYLIFDINYRIIFESIITNKSYFKFGVTTDGSSDNSIKLYLKNSNIRVRVSSMLSFQRNGKTLDGKGTTLDIFIPEDENKS